MASRLSCARRRAFTLIEILVVIAIIALLAALLFPAFSRARETGRQSTCQSNLHQLSVAIQQYFQDERRYPDSLVDLLPGGANYNDGNPTPTPLPDTVNGYLKNGSDGLVCPDDDLQIAAPHSSYGALQKFPFPATDGTAPAPPAVVKGTNADPNANVGDYAYNFWGYDEDGFAYPTADYAASKTPNGSIRLVVPSTTDPTTNTVTNLAFTHPAMTTPPKQRPSRDVINYSLANRFAPPSTIITHCMFHRIQTATNLTAAGQMGYTTPPSDSSLARDVVLRLDGSVKAVDVSNWKPTATADLTDPNYIKSNRWLYQTPAP